MPSDVGGWDIFRKLMRLEPLADTQWFNPKVGEYWQGLTVYGYRAAVSLPADTLFASYYPVLRRVRFDQMVIRVTAAGGAGALFRFGIYGDDGSLYPGSLLAQSGDRDGTVLYDHAVPVDLTLKPGAYWVAYLCNDPAIAVPRSDYFIPPPLRAQVGSDRYGGHYSIAHAYGPLPDPFPAGATFAARYLQPLVRLRVAEVY